MIELRQHTHSPRECGQLTNHKRNKLSEGDLMSLLCMLYVDNGVLTFATREQLKTGLSLIYSQFKKFRLKIHIGRGPKAYKTEFVFFPPPGLWVQNSIAPDTSNNKYKLSVRYKESFDNRKMREMKE